MFPLVFYLSTFFLLPCFSAENILSHFTEGRFLVTDKNYTVLNSVLSQAILTLGLSIEPREASAQIPVPFLDSVLNLDVDLLATVGEEGVCRDLAVGPGGQIVLTGQFLENDNGMQVYEMELIAERVQFNCTIPLQIEATSTFEGAFQVGFGNLTFVSESANLSQKLTLYSSDFSQGPPTLFQIDSEDCAADVGQLLYTGENLLLLSTGEDQTELVVEALTGDPTLVQEDVTDQFCTLVGDLGETLGELLIDNPLVNSGSEFYIEDPFEIGSSGQIPALLEQIDLLNSLSSKVASELIDLFDQDNIVTNFLIPETDATRSVIATILEIFVSGDAEGDPLLLFLEEIFPEFASVASNGVTTVDLVGLLDELLGEELTFELSLELEDSVTFDVTFAIRRFELVVDPPETDIIPQFDALGAQTLLLDGIVLDSFSFDADFFIKVDITNEGTIDILDFPFEISVEEEFNVAFTWEDFSTSIAFLFGLNVEHFVDLEFGDIIANIYDCLMLSFERTPRFTGFTLSHSNIELAISSLTDGILALVTDLVDVLGPAYQSVVPVALEYLASEFLINEEILEDGEDCPDVQEDDVDPYDFSGGIFETLSETVDANLINEILEEFASDDNPSFFVFGNEDLSDEGVGFNFTTIPLDGYTQFVEVFIRQLGFTNVRPPTFNNISVFDIDEDSEFYPQELLNFISISSAEEPVTVLLTLALLAEEPIFDEEEPIPENPLPIPDTMFEQESLLKIVFVIERADAIVDFVLSYTERDVGSLTINKLLNIGCYGELLDFPGGVTKLEVDIEGIEITAECDPCDNRLFNLTAQTFSDSANWPDAWDLLETDLFNAFGKLVVDLFTEEKFAKTIEISELICVDDDFSVIEIGELEVPPHETDYFLLTGFLLFFLAACAVPMCFFRAVHSLSPTLNEISKNKLNKEFNKETGEAEYMHLKQALYKNFQTPWILRKLMPLCLVGNIVLFVIGDTGPAVRLGLLGHMFDIPLQDDNFLTLSIITSVIELFKSGGYLLAVVLFTLSVAWPYVKIMLMSMCWFFPPTWLSVETRGRTIEIIDILGRFSFAEFHFLVFVLVVFKLEGSSPQEYDFLPQDDLLKMELLIEPLVSLLTFAMAVLFSIILSNIMLVVQHQIEDEARINHRKVFLSSREKADDESQLTLEDDKKKIKLVDWKFTIHGESDVRLYSIKLTCFAKFFTSLGVLASLAAIILAGALQSLHIEIYGFFSYFVLYQLGSREFDLSVFELLGDAYTLYSGNWTVYYVGVVFIGTIIVMPILQTFLLFTLMFKPMNLRQGRIASEAHHIISVWCCVDVFAIALAFTVLELPTVADGLASTLEFCDDLAALMEGIFEPMQWVDEKDVTGGCFAMEASVVSGAYVAVGAVFSLSIINFIISKLFFSFIAGREKITEMATEPVGKETVVGPFHSFMQAVGFIAIEKIEYESLNGVKEEPEIKAEFVETNGSVTTKDI